MYNNEYESSEDETLSDSNNQFIENEITDDLLISNKITQIYQIYDEVLKNFKECNDMVYNPNIFAYLDKQKFMKWITNNTH